MANSGISNDNNCNLLNYTIHKVSLKLEVHFNQTSHNTKQYNTM